MRRSHTLRNTRTSLPAAAATVVDDLGVLHEDRVTAPRHIDTLEATLRSEIFERERENDRLQDQILSLQAQLSQRPPLSAIQELENEKKTLDMILLGTQRENEKMMTELERGKKREKLLETELRRLVGDNWQSALNLTSLDNPSPKLSAASRGLIHTTIGGNPNFSISSLSLSAPQSRRILPSSRTDVLSESENTQEEGSTGSQDGDSDEEVDSRLRRPSEKEVALQQTNELMRRKVEQMRLLILGMDKRLVEREERLSKAMQRAEQENKGLEAKLRELDLNTATTNA